MSRASQYVADTAMVEANARIGAGATIGPLARTQRAIVEAVKEGFALP